MHRLSVVLLVTLTVGCMTASAGNTPLVEYRRSGGIRGLNDHLVVNTGGTATLQRKIARLEFTLHPDTLAQLRDQLGSIDFSKLEREYSPARPGADLIEYQIVYGRHAVRAVDTAIPDELHPLIEFLNRLVERR